MPSAAVSGSRSYLSEGARGEAMEGLVKPWRLFPDQEALVEVEGIAAHDDIVNMRVVDHEWVVEGIEDTVVIHADQVGLSSGSGEEEEAVVEADWDDLWSFLDERHLEHLTDDDLPGYWLAVLRDIKSE